MKTQNKSRLILIVFIFLFIIISSTANAVNLNSYKFIANINDDGSADITTVWVYNDDKGTEHFVPISKNGIKVSNLKVKRNGIKYKTLNDWYVDASFEDKANKAGIHDIGDEIELCWGIGEYGLNEYEVSYHINGFVKNLNDAQMIHYRLFNDGMSEAPDTAEYIIKRSNGEPFNDEVKVWAFGFEGDTYIENGEVVGRTKENLGPHNYMHSLVKFPLNSFNIPDEHHINEDFQHFKDLAFEGSNYIEDNQGFEGFGIFGFLITLFTFLPMILFGFVFGLILKTMPDANKVQIHINQSDLKGEYYSQAPFDKDLHLLYFLLKHLNMSSEKDIITYFFLKWIKEGVLIKEDVLKDKLFSKDKVRLKIVKEPLYGNIMDKDNPEVIFFNILKSAAVDGYLDEGEFNKWMSKRSNRTDYAEFKDKLYNVSEDLMFSEGYIYREKIEKKSNDYYITRLSPYGKELAINLVKFKNYLKDYSLINERAAMNVHIWDELMLYAAVFGIAQEVKREFNKISPDYENLTSYSNDSITTSLLIGSTISNSYTRHTSSSSSRSSGGGGSSSIGGGGGGFGGSSGGGTR